MATNEMLFACTHCHKRCKFEELSSSQQLCKDCRKKFPLVTCTYCRLEFHSVQNSSSKGSQPACEHCAGDFKQYGTPSFCSICNLQSAFNGKKCSRCQHSAKKYGPPVACEHCKLVCAFQKPEDARRKVDGKTLCLLCTINYKKAQFKKKSEQKPHKSYSSKYHSAKHKDEEPSAPKKIKLENPGSTSGGSGYTQLQSFTAQLQPQLHSLSFLGRDTRPLDILNSNHVVETDKLQNEISTLKKQLAQKDQQLLEKDKMICTLKAEGLEKDKDLRMKLQGQLKSHTEMVESLQAEIRLLKKQISQASHKGSSRTTVAHTGAGFDFSTGSNASGGSSS